MYTLVQYLAGSIGVWITCVQGVKSVHMQWYICATHNSYQRFGMALWLS